MRAKGYDYWKVATLIAALFCVGAAYQAANDDAPQIIKVQKMEVKAPDFTTTWKSDGMDQRVSTYIEDGETHADASARHKAKVTAHLVNFPKDPEPVE